MLRIYVIEISCSRRADLTKGDLDHSHVDQQGVQMDLTKSYDVRERLLRVSSTVEAGIEISQGTRDEAGGHQRHLNPAAAVRPCMRAIIWQTTRV